MESSQTLRQGGREYLGAVLIITRREIRDFFRDWRLVIPIGILTLFFPVLATATASEVLQFVSRQGGAPIIWERAFPFLLLAVGFFPISFSLVVALETFVGEKERKSLEPLLASPLTDGQLYLGKTLAAMIPPLLASYVGISFYLFMLYLIVGWFPHTELLLQVLALTTAKGVVMVSGAVIVSSQTTSVRAANLLASFIIIPMALLVQGEAVIMFWGRYPTLWWVLAFLVVVDVLLIRMGIRIFSREELLGREIDMMRIGRLWRAFRNHAKWEWWFFGRTPESLHPRLRWLGKPTGLYFRQLPAILRQSGIPLLVALVGMFGGFVLGLGLADQFPYPFDPGFNAPGPPWGYLLSNIRALLLAVILGTFSFGAMAAATLLATTAVVTYLAVQVAQAGHSPWLFMLTMIAPHGVFEILASVLWTALTVRLGATFVIPSDDNQPVADAWLQRLADLYKVTLAVVLPLLTIAAFTESYITPLIVNLAYGG
jgi:ABC-type transport system involved in multi-copper enzyme maturation permease subunit